MPSIEPWQQYERDVREIAGDIMAHLTGKRVGVEANRNVLLPGTNSPDPHQVDVVAKAGTDALFIECKRYTKEVGIGDVTQTIYNFEDVCSAFREWRWRLAIVAPREIRPSARMPITRPHAVSTLKNLAGGSIPGSSYFIYFHPPSAPSAPAPFFVLDDDEVRIGQTGARPARGVEENWSRLHDPRLSLALRVGAGLSLLTECPGIIAGDTGASRVLVHGLMHLGRTQDAMYVRRITGPRRAGDPSLEIEDHMMRFNLDPRKDGRIKRHGLRQIQALTKMVGTVPVRDDVSIRSFAAPIVARWDGFEEGLRLLDGIKTRLGALETEDAPYYELLRLVRTAQLTVSKADREDLLADARLVLGGLPTWNRFIAEALIDATEARPEVLHGLDVPFDAEAWAESAGITSAMSA